MSALSSLQKAVDKNSENISNITTSLNAGIRRILAILVVILVIIVAAFSCALVEKTAAIAKLEERLGLMGADVSALRNDFDEKIEKAHTAIDGKINSTLEQLLSEREEDCDVDHQIGYR